MTDALALAAGVALAAVGGERFVHGAVGVARAARIPAGIIAATVAAFATSSPELAVAATAAAEGRPEIGIGDALGSSAVNLGLVLGVALLFGPLRADRAGLRRDIPVAVAAPIVVLLLAADGRLSRSDAAVLVVVFLAWLTIAVLQAARARSHAAADLGDSDRGRAILDATVGLVLLVIAGRLVATAAEGIGDALGFDTFVVGATLVALGTSTPELATTIIARRRGHDDVGLGTLVGSNVFNTLWIAGLAALIEPAEVPAAELLPAAAAGAVLPLVIIPRRAAPLGRARAVSLLAVYVAFVAVLVTTSGP